MDYNLLLIGGGREKDTSKAINDISSVLSKKYEIGKVWIDNHGWMWLDNEKGERVSLLANKMVPLSANELIIGGDSVGSYSIGKVWPVCKGENMVSGGIKSVLEFGGFEVVGSSSMMTIICDNKEMSKAVLKGVNFSDNQELRITKEEWENSHLDIEDKIDKNFGFPVEIKYRDSVDKISIYENFSNMIFKIFEEEVDFVDVMEAKNVKFQYVVGFLGGRNFLPSKLCELKNDNLEKIENKDLERELQSFVIDFVKKFDVKDMGLIHIDKGMYDWKVRNIELMPDMSIDGIFARLWNLSGINYSTMINKIFDESSS